MEDVERGQIILITGLAIAVILVSLVLLMNSVIYSQNLATREPAGASGGSAVVYRTTVLDGTGGLLERENAAEHGSYDAVRSNVTDALTGYDQLLTQSYLQRSTLVGMHDVTGANATRGTLLRQTTDTTFENKSNVADWTLVTNATNRRVRNLVLRINRSELGSSTASGAFRVVVENTTGATWNASIYDASGAITVDGSGPGSACSVTAPAATVDLIRGTVNGTACPGLRFASGVGSTYDVRFRHGDRAGGTYRLTVRNASDAAHVVDSGFATGPTTDVPYAVPAVYSETLGIRYRTDQLSFATHVRVAPGEPT